MADGDDDIAAAIRTFISQQETPQQQQSEVIQDPEPQTAAPPQPPPRPAPRAAESSLYHFIYNGAEAQLPEAEATPTGVAAHFELDRDSIHLTRKDKRFDIHPTEDRFRVTLIPGRAYTVIETPRPAPTPTPTPRHRHDQQQPTQECWLIANGQKKSVPAKTTKKSTITSLFGINKQVAELRLIGNDGAVISTQNNQFDLTPGAKYFVTYTGQKVLENDVDDDHDDSGEVFSKPMAFLGPYMIAVVRILHSLSLTKDSIIFAANPDSKNSKSSKLYCSNKLSNCAYQVAYRFNAALKAIQTLEQNHKCNPETPEHVFHSQQECKDFQNLIGIILKLLEKAHEELEEFLQIVLRNMRAANSSVDTVKISLEVETNREKRNLEKEERKKIDGNVIMNMCEKIVAKDDEIRPFKIELSEVSGNRRIQNIANELTEKVLFGLEGDAVLKDVTNLLNFCAKISHCNLMHWLFTYNLLENFIEDYEAEEKNAPEFEIKAIVVRETYHAIKYWKTVSCAIPLSINLNEEVGDIPEFWNSVKDAISTAQYALEILCIE